MTNEKCALCFGVAHFRWLNPSTSNPETTMLICGLCAYYFAGDDDGAVLVKL